MPVCYATKGCCSATGSAGTSGRLGHPRVALTVMAAAGLAAGCGGNQSGSGGSEIVDSDDPPPRLFLGRT
jgi:hypothetical protein